MIIAVSTITFINCEYLTFYYYIPILEMELKEEYDENAYGSRSCGSSGATLQPSNAQNMTGNLLIFLSFGFLYEYS